MQTLLPAAVSGEVKADEVKPYKFAACINSLEFVDTVDVTLDGSPVTAPHWTLQGKNDIPHDWSRQAKRIKTARRFYSKKPAAYTLPGGRKVKVEVEVTKSENVGDKGRLHGSLGGLLIEGDCPTSVGKHPVDATITQWIDAIDGLVGKLIWRMRLKSPDVTASLGSTLIEVYLLLDKPAKMYDAGLPAEVLRFLSRKPKLGGRKTSEDVGATVTRYIHRSHGMEYDTEEGRSAYKIGPQPPAGIGHPSQAINGFPVVDYALQREVVINCYDQAAAVQSLSGAVGAVVDWVYMNPYGFISSTKLVGVKGRCNNPFYMAPTLDGTITEKPYIDPEDERRSAFGNHAFCSLSSKILDACAGPHLGTEPLKDYIAAAIDHKTKLNLYRGFPGTIDDAKIRPGIVSTDPASSV